MRKSFAEQSAYWLKVVSLGLVLGIGLQFAQAWTAPSAAPPGGNISGPVTLGNSAQYKTGYLGVGTNSVPLYPLVVGGDAMISGKVYSFSTLITDLGTTLATKDYVDSRVSGGGGSGTVTNVASGYGLIGGPITTTGTLEVDANIFATRNYVDALIRTVNATLNPYTVSCRAFNSCTVTCPNTHRVTISICGWWNGDRIRNISSGQTNYVNYFTATCSYPGLTAGADGTCTHL